MSSDLFSTENTFQSNSVNATLIGDYVRLQLLQDTIGIDSVVSVLSNYGGSNDQIRMLAALSRRGDSIFGKSFTKRLSPQAKTYLDFNAELKNRQGKHFQNALKNAENPYHIWAMAEQKSRNGSEIPNPIELPEKRLKILDDKGNENSLNIYPNPTDQLLNLSYDGKGMIAVQIFDIKGSLLKSVTLSAEEGNLEISTGTFKNGVHIIKVIQNDNIIGTEQIIIQH